MYFFDINPFLKNISKYLKGTLDGSICYVVPVSERMYKRMNALNVSLTAGINHIAGLNPRGYR